MRTLLRGIAPLLVLIAFVIPTQADILNVPADYPTVAAAVNAVVAGDEIVIAAGTYNHSSMLLNHGGFTIRGVGLVVLQGSGGQYSEAFHGSLDYDYLPVVFDNLVFENYYFAITYDMDFEAEFLGCTFRDNGMGMMGCGPGPFIFTDCLFENNHAPWAGGALNTCGAVLEVSGCVFRNNSAVTMGGAVYSDTPFGSRVFSNCLFTGNDAPTGAAVMVEYGGPVDFVNCTFHANGSPGTATIALDDANDTINMSRCIVSGSLGSDFLCIDGGVLNLTCTNSWGNAEGDWVGCAADDLGVDGNFSADPLYCDVLAEDFTLHSTSPCAPAGNGCGELIGAFPVACGTVATESTSWSAVKSLY